MLRAAWRFARRNVAELRRRIVVLRRFIQSYQSGKKPRVSAMLEGGVGLYYWDERENLGDYLSYVVCDHLVRSKGFSGKAAKDSVLYAIGSIIGFIRQDAVVWGSGILSPDWAYRLYAKHSRMDIRAVRGPNTAAVLRSIGKHVPQIYGDPAILMPYVYQPENAEIEYDVCFIPHFSDQTEIPDHPGICRIEIQTRDYRSVIDTIVRSKCVISSSLHGVILAETYGIPAVLLLHDYQNIFKYEDWYLSTGRQCVYARTFAEAMRMEALPLPDLHAQQKALYEAFPWDLWED